MTICTIVPTMKGMEIETAIAMNNHSDRLFDQHADLDFADAKPVGQVPALARLLAERGGKSRITMRVDNSAKAEPTDTAPKLTDRSRPPADVRPPTA